VNTLDELRALLSEATQRPWQTENIPYNGLDDPCIFSGATGQYVCQLVYDQQSITQRPEVDADAALIVAAINALPGLLAICNAAKTALGLLDDPSCPVTGLDETRRARAILAAALKAPDPAP
jgi:hypothetical protein